MILQQSTMNLRPGDGAEVHHDAPPDQLNCSTSSSPPPPVPSSSPANGISCSRPASAHKTISNDCGPINKSRQAATTTGRVEVRLLVRRREAGALIGKRGANIKRLRETFAKSTFNIPDTGNGPERIVCIAADSLASLEAILADLAQLFLEKSCQLAKFQTPAAATSRTQLVHDQIELKQLINSSHAGLLIGMGGQSIRKLRNDSKAAIKIFEMCCPNSNERVCAIKAKPPVVVATIKMVQEIIDASPPALKASLVHKPYDALNYDLSLLDKYGGYAPDELGPLELMQLAGAQTTRPDQFAASGLDVRHHLIGGSNSARRLYGGKSTLSENNHFRPQRSMFPSAAAAAADGISALLGALDHGMLSTSNLMRSPAPSLTRELNQRGGHHAARYHPYLASSSQPPLTTGHHSLHEHERLLIAQHLQMLSAAHRHQLLRTPNASGCHGGCSCCSHGLNNYNQQQHDNQRASSSCSCAPATDTVARGSPKSSQTSGDLQSRAYTDKCSPPPSVAHHDKQIGQDRGPPV